MKNDDGERPPISCGCITMLTSLTSPARNRTPFNVPPLSTLTVPTP